VNRLIRKQDYSKRFFWIFALIMGILVFFVIKPFISVLLTSIFLAYIFYPLYLWLNKKVKNKNLSASIVLFVVILIILLPLFFVLNTVTQEAYVSYLLSKQKILGLGDTLKKCDPSTNSLCGMINVIGDFLSDPKVQYHLKDNVEKISGYIVDSVSNLLFSIPKFLLSFFVMLFTMFYLFKDGASMGDNLKRVLPLRDVYKQHLFERFGNVTFSIVYGYMVVAIIQGVLAAIGFFIFGVRSPIIWGIVVVFAALIPVIGTGIVWLPLALTKLLNGIVANSAGEIVGGILFILYGAIIISSIDNLIRPKIIGDKAKIHPILVLVGALGGLYMLGFIGVVVGPLILTLFVTFVQAYEKDTSTRKKHDNS